MTSKLLLLCLILTVLILPGCPSQKSPDVKPSGEGLKPTGEKSVERSLTNAQPGECDQWAVDLFPGGDKIQVKARKCGEVLDLAGYRFNFAISDNQSMSGSHTFNDQTFTKLPVIFEFTELSPGTPVAFGEVYWITVSIQKGGGSSAYSLEPFPIINVPDGIANQVIEKKNGKIYIAGSFTGCIDFDPGPGEKRLIANHRDCYLAVYDQTGNYIWAGSWGGSREDQVSDIAIDSSGNVFLTGFIQGSADMDPNPLSITAQTVNGNRDSFVLKLAYDSAGNTYAYSKHISITGTGIFDEGRCIDIDESGSVTVSGIYEGTLSINPSLTATGGTDIYVAKFDADLVYVNSSDYGDNNKSDIVKSMISCYKNVIRRTYLTGVRIELGSGGTRTGNTFLKVIDANGNPLPGIPDIGVIGIWDEGEGLVCDPSNPWNVWVYGRVEKTSGNCNPFRSYYQASTNTISNNIYTTPTSCSGLQNHTFGPDDTLYITGEADQESAIATLQILYADKKKGVKSIICSDTVWDEGAGLTVESNYAYVTGLQSNKESGYISGMFFTVINTSLDENQCEVYVSLPVM